MSQKPRRGKPVAIVDYDARWPSVYESERAAILGAVGDRLVAVEHIGSTAILGLGAKPFVDLMAGLPRLADADACIGPLGEIGYRFVPEAMADLPDDRYFEKWTDGVEIAHLHLTEYESTFWRDHLLFRDYLRAHPEAARAYERLKRELAAHHTSATYSYAKTDFIRAALARAADRMGERQPRP